MHLQVQSSDTYIKDLRGYQNGKLSTTRDGKLSTCPPSLRYIYITISTFTSVRPSGVGVPLSCFQFLQSYYKVSLIKVAWYVLRVKDMHSWSPPDLWGPWDEEKLSYIHYDIRREEAKLSILKIASVFHHLPSVGPKQLCALAHLGCTREAGTS